MWGTCFFVIVGTNDNPIYEADFTATSKVNNPSLLLLRYTVKESTHFNQFILHSALDLVEELQWKNNNMYETLLTLLLSYFVTGCCPAGILRLSIGLASYLSLLGLLLAVIMPSSCISYVSDMKFLLLHDRKDEDAIRYFFTEVHEFYLKVLLFFTPNIDSTRFCSTHSTHQTRLYPLLYLMPE